MNQIEKLIEELCPDGVEYKPLGEVTQIYRGKRFVKADMQESGVPCMHYGEIYTKYGTSATESISYLSKVRAKSLRFAQPNDVVMATAGETIEDIGKSVAWLGNEPIVIHDACYVISGKFDPKFAAYYFNSRAFKDQIRNKISSSKISSISTKNVAKTLFPILPIHMQEEISETLELFEKLEAELEARKKQYEFYRDNLMSELAIRYPTLKIHEIANVQRGQSMTAKRAIPGEFPVIANGPDPVYTHNHFNRDGENVVIARSGAKAGLVSFWTGKFFLTDAFSFQAHRDVISSRFLYYFLQSRQDQIDSNRRGAGVPHVRISEVEQSEIPIPPLEEQQRIVNILNKFDALVNDLTSGLPAEIEARRKQYEYYRDQLLTFKELSA